MLPGCVRSLLLAAGVLLGSVCPAVAWAQPSLAAEDRLESVPVTINGATETFTLIRDATDPLQWYYAPDHPRLAERLVNGQLEPEIQLFTFQGPAANNPQDLVGAGFLQLSMTLAAPSSGVKALKDLLSTREGVPPSQISLETLPVDSAEVTLYTPGSGKWLTSAANASGIVPVVDAQAMIFWVPLTQMGADIYRAIVDSNTGLPVAIVLTFRGIARSLGAGVQINWDRTYQLYQQNPRFRAAAAYYGLFAPQSPTMARMLYDGFVNNDCLHLDQPEAASDADLARDFPLIVSHMNQALLENFRPPEGIDPAQFGEPDPNQFFAAFGYGSDLRDPRNVPAGTEHITLNLKYRQQGKEPVVGFLGIGSYPASVREHLVTAIHPSWPVSYFLLPAVGEAALAGVDRIDLEVSLLKGGDRITSQVVTWRPETDWTDSFGRNVSFLAHSLLDGPDAQQLEFESVYSITSTRPSGPDLLPIHHRQPAYLGESSITTPLAEVDAVIVDGSELTWHRLNAASKLDRVRITLSSGNRSLEVVMKPPSINGHFQLPAPVYWLVNRDASEPVLAHIQYELSDGTVIPWRLNGDLRSSLLALSVTLLDSDWQ